ncbi:MAG: hydantoinase/oxoprolinase family protein [Proteobacteria bacterium]|nr:hydantoinase/oxoprolinase family protein [Pseudomonadota bacterium]MBI3497605.1 hydantoinase/oxoprolinase family protein [Pseudomonadota bacterium]
MLQRLRVGVDSGGTFTDICTFDESACKIHVWKVPSTPQDPSLGIATGVEQALKELSGADGKWPDVVYFGHGTTVATNALIAGTGAETGMLTTAGFRDILELRRQKRDSLYDLQTEKPEILAKRDKRLEVRERVLFDGRILVELQEEDVRAAARKLRAEGVQSVAVCFLFSYIEPRHELMVKTILAEEMPGAFVSSSHEVAPEFREYERFSTTVVNAYVGPIIKDYLARLQPRLAKAGITVPPHLMQSNGGTISSEAAQKFPARTVLSGPAAGVMGALAVGRLSGFDSLITFDMGGTSTDVSLIDSGRMTTSSSSMIRGYPLKLPMLDIHTVGAGGGSIAHVDAGGLLKVGPRSASADPGPVCYGRGNQEPTVTDANVVLQVLNPNHLLNGRLSINQALAKQAIIRLGEQLGLDPMATAQGIVSVVIANMTKAIRVISIERGYDPRDYVLFSFGGAGPCHAARLANALEVPRIVVPKHPGILCALGLLLSDMRTRVSLTRLQPLSEECADSLSEQFTSLEQRVAAWFEREAIPSERRLTTRSIDMRYGGQGFELNIPVSDASFDAAQIVRLQADFECAHQQAYGYIAEAEPIHITTLRVEGVGLVPKAELPAHSPATSAVADALAGTRQVWLPETGGFSALPVYDRIRLGPGHQVIGPAIIEQMDSTTLVLPDQSAAVDPYLNLVIER